MTTSPDDRPGRQESLVRGNNVDAERLGSFLETVAPDVVTAIRDAIVDTAGSSLIGLYLYGSLVAGDFDRDISDLDFIAVLSMDPSDELSVRLNAMHETLADQYPEWAGRIEVTYVAERRLRRLPERIPRMAVISPGEPFHLIEAGPEWILTWFPAREEAISLKGPAIASIVPELPRQEFLAAVRERLNAFRTEMKGDSSLGSCAYAVLTVSRGLYTLEFGSRTSKESAARWLANEYPEWASLIESALAWRQEQWTKSSATDPTAVLATRRFVKDITESVLN